MPKNIQILTKWMEDIGMHVDRIKEHDATISRRQLLRILYRLGDDAKKATAAIKEEMEHA